MQKQAKDFILNNLNIGRDYSEDGEAEYSGRGMYGRSTHAVVVDYADEVKDGIQYLIDEADEDDIEALIESGLICESGDDSDFVIDDEGYEINFRRDNLGLDYIIY